MSTTKDKINALITIVLMFGIGFIPPVSELTVSGMKILGILIGTIYGVSFCATAWPCLMAIGAMVILGVAPIGTILSTGLGSDSIMLMIFFFAFTAVLEQHKITEFIATFLISRKFIEGKPWVFTYILMIGTMFAGAFGSSFPAMIVFWGILIATCKMFDMKPFTPYPTVAFMGICLGGLASSSTWLFRGNPLYCNAMLKNITGGALELNFGMYALLSFSVWMIVLAGYIAICKYIFRIDLGAMKNIDSSVVDLSYLNLNAKQKVLLGYTLLILVVYCVIGFTPTASPLGQYFATFGVTAPIMIILTLMALTRVEGEALVDISKACKEGVVWDTVILSGVLLGMSTIMMTADTGISATILALLGPVFAGKGVIFLTVVIVVISVILTNFMANTTVVLMFTPVILSFSTAMGFDPLPVISMMLISAHIAFLTPAASPFASLLFGYSNWVKPGDIYKYGALAAVMMVVVFLVVGIPLSNVLM